MSSSLLHPPSHLSPATALKLSQQAPAILPKSSVIAASALPSLLSTTETPELWTIYENLLLSCLRTGDDESAHQCLSKLVDRFGDDNERVMALKGLFKEATAANDAALDAVLKEYEQILDANPVNLVSLSGQLPLFIQ
jgi:ER membrane protein complex subunit 2